jgi:hypothetical protein
MPSFSVRCLFRWRRFNTEQAHHTYEERITLWNAASFDAAIAFAEEEAREYAQDNGFEVLDLCQAYELVDEVAVHGVEVYSLLRDSSLEPEEYIDTFFDTGDERTLES